MDKGTHAMTRTQRTTLARMSDGEWYVCHDSTTTTLSALNRAGMIRCVDNRRPVIEREWMITPRGSKALRDSE
jgi:hypothetical protein